MLQREQPGFVGYVKKCQEMSRSTAYGKVSWFHIPAVPSRKVSSFAEKLATANDLSRLTRIFVQSKKAGFFFLRSGGKMGNQQNVGYQRCINMYQRYTVVYIQLGPSIASASRDETCRAGASSSEVACLGRTIENNSMWLSSVMWRICQESADLGHVHSAPHLKVVSATISNM